MSSSENKSADLRSFGEDLWATIVLIQASCRSSAKEVRVLGRAFQKKEAELEELKAKLRAALAALPEPRVEPTEGVHVPQLDNRKKALTMTEIDRIADLDRRGYSSHWIAGQAGCSLKNIQLIIRIAAFFKDIRFAIHGKICSAHFALLLVNQNGEGKTRDFFRKATEWYDKSGRKVREGEFLLSKGTIEQYARLIGVEALTVR